MLAGEFKTFPKGPLTVNLPRMSEWSSDRYDPAIEKCSILN